MTDQSSDGPAPPLLSEEQRAAAFSNAHVVHGSDGRPRDARSPIPPRFVLLVMATFVVLGLGGVLIEHFYGGGGSTSTTTTVFTLPPTPTIPTGHQLSGSTMAMMGLKQIDAAMAPPITLLDQHSRRWSLASAKGKVVVLAFYNANCNDICPVLGDEIRQAASLLGVHRSQVDFAVVNTDPKHFAVRADPPGLTTPGLLGTESVYFLTGPLNALNAVWIAYGLQVRVGLLATQVAHNNVIYFITPTGHLHALAVPFGNEDQAGRFTLSAKETRRFASGIAIEAISLAK